MSEQGITNEQAAPLIAAQDSITFPCALNVQQFGHRRNLSGDVRINMGNNEDEGVVVRKYSDSLMVQSATVSMSRPSFKRDKLSVTRNVNLDKLNVSEVTRPTNTNNSLPLTTPPASTSPVGNTIHNVSRSTDVRDTVIPMRIYLPHVLKKDEEHTDENVSGVQYEFKGGDMVTADYILNLLARNYRIDQALVQETFALWMVSPLLEYQLKPHHRPYEVACGWAAVVSRFVSDATEEEIQEDKPVLFLKRNITLSPAREIEIVTFCPYSLELLWLDARASIFADRYPINTMVAAELAGFGFAIDLATKEVTPSIEYIRRNLEEQLPEYMADNIRGRMVFGKTLSSSKQMEVVLSSWKSAASIISEANGDVSEVRRQYLAKLREAAPYYGSAFFKGSIERPSSSPFKSLKKFLQAVTSGDSAVEVRIGVNRHYITVIDVVEREVLLVQKISDCSWRMVGCTNGEPESELVLLLNFPDNEEADEKTEKRRKKSKSENVVKTNLLQVFGSETLLINATLSLMSDLVDEYPDSGHESMSESGSPRSNSDASDASNHVAVTRTPSVTKCNRLCLASFRDGTCVKASGSFKRVNWNSLCKNAVPVQ